MTGRIGILGGIGPEATGEYYNKLIKRFGERKLITKNADYPQIIINSIPAPELIFNKDHEADLDEYIQGLKELDQFGVDFILMVCNTAYVFYDKFQSSIRVPILDIREEVKKTILKSGVKSYLIIGTPNTIKTGLYKFSELKSYEPNEEELNQLTDCIFKFNQGVEQQEQTLKVRKIVDKYLKQGAETVVLGCTEFAVMLGNEKFQKINTIDVMVEATIDRFLSIASEVKTSAK